MSSKYSDGDLVVGVISHAVLVEDKKNKLNLEIGFTSDKKPITMDPKEGTENITPFDSFTRLYLDDCDLKEEDNKDLFDKAKIRRGISRDGIESLTGEKLADDWSDKGYQRLTPDHVKSVIPGIVGKEVLFKAREFNGSIMWNLYVPRAVPVAMKLTDLKAKLRAKQAAAAVSAG